MPNLRIGKWDNGEAFYSGSNLLKFMLSGANRFIFGTDLKNERPSWATSEHVSDTGSITFDITGMTSASTVGENINALLTAGRDVTVNGTSGIGSTAFTITIPANRNVSWELSESASTLTIGGAGNFTIANGSKITTANQLTLANFSGTFTVGGEIIKSSGTTGGAVVLGSGNNNPIIKVLASGKIEVAIGGVPAILATSNANATILIEGGVVQRNIATPGSAVIVIGGNNRLHISGGEIAKSAGTNTGTFIDVQGDAEIYLSGTPDIPNGTIMRASAGNGVGYYTGASNLAKFNTTTGANIWTAGTNLSEGAPTWAAQ
jgi:hypothetical protein